MDIASLAISCRHRLVQDGFALVEGLLTAEELEELQMVSERKIGSIVEHSIASRVDGTGGSRGGTLTCSSQLLASTVPTMTKPCQRFFLLRRRQTPCTSWRRRDRRQQPLLLPPAAGRPGVLTPCRPAFTKHCQATSLSTCLRCAAMTLLTGSVAACGRCALQCGACSSNHD